MCFICRSAHIESLFDLVWIHCCDGYIAVVTEIQNRFTIHKVLDVPPQEKFIVLKSGLLRGQNIGQLLQIQALWKFSFRGLLTAGKRRRCYSHKLSMSKHTLYRSILKLNNFDMFSNFLIKNFYNPGILF
jgi:hypothetical protein